MPEQPLETRIRLRILDAAHRASKGHLGSALSVADIVAAVGPAVRGLGTDDPARDRFVLSKGHAALAWYSALAELGVIDEDAFRTYGADDSLLGTHPDPEMAGVDFMTGSLGQGFSFAVGSAIAAGRAAKPWRTYVVLSDSELDEGVTWEAALLANQHRCPITVVLDLNGQQALGYTKDVLDTGGAPNAIRALGWDVVEVDGHDVAAIQAAIAAAGDGPLFVVARTIAGHGVDFMEGEIKWHYLPMTDAEYQSAREQVDV